MRIFLFILILSTSFTKVIAGDSTQKIQVLATVNCTKFAKQFLSLSNSSLEISPYLVGMRFGTKSHWIRFNYGIDYSSNSTGSIDFSNSTYLYDQDIRVGYQREIPLSDKFSSFIGGDIMFNSFQNKTTSRGQDNYNESNNKSTGYGGGINLGVQWNITKRISIYSEALLGGTISKGTNLSINEFGGGQRFTNQTSNDQTVIRFTPPTSIFFHFKF